MTDDRTGAASDVVTLSIPARRHFIAAVRSLCTSVAAQYGLTVDAIEDLQIAVDEAGALLLPLAATVDADLVITLTLAGDELRVVVDIAGAQSVEPDREGLSWTVLSAVAEDLSVDHADGRLRISFGKRREVMAR